MARRGTSWGRKLEMRRRLPKYLRPVQWLRSDMGITLNGSDVSAWADQSGKRNHVTQGTAVNQPAYNATGWSVSIPTLDFVNADSHHLLMPAGVGSHNSLTAFAVYDWTFAPLRVIINASSGGVVLAAGGNAANSFGIFDGTQWCNVAPSSSGQHVAAVELNASVPSARFFDNGALVGATSPTYDGTITWGFGASGAGIGRSDAQSFDGKLAEVIFCNRVLTDTERHQVFAYLMGRYGL